MNETAEIPKYLERNSNVENAVSGLDHAFKENGLDYFVIGSVARIAYMNEGVPSDEIDIVVPNINQSQKAEEILDILRAKYPTVGFDTSLTSVVQREGSEHVYQLRHGRINVEIDGEIMTPKRVNIHGVEFDTLPPATLLHTYAFVGGPFREKDWKNAIKYARWIRRNEIYEHSNYKLFHEFGKARWRKSPLRRIQYIWRQVVNAAPEAVRSQIVDKLYSRTPVLEAREVFNKLEEIMCGV